MVADSPGVGNNLQEHPVAWVAGYVNVSTYNTEVTPSGWVRHGLNWLLRGKGPAASPIAQAVAFLRTRPEAESRPDIQLHFTPTGYEFGPRRDQAAGAAGHHHPGQRLPAEEPQPAHAPLGRPQRAAAHLLEELLPGPVPAGARGATRMT